MKIAFKTVRSNLRLSWVLLALALSVFALAFIYFDAFVYDVLAYHAPFAAIATNIPVLRNFELEQFLQNRFIGFPPVCRFALFPGLFLGLPRLLILPNLIALVILFYACKSVLKLNPILCFASVFSFPIVLYGFRSAYQDFFVGALITAGLLFLLRLLISFSWQFWLLSTICLLLASTTKFQGLIQSVLVLSVGFMLTPFVSPSLRDMQRSSLIREKSRLLVLLILTAMLIFIHPAINLINHSNPFFPVAAAGFQGPEFNYTEAQGYTQYFYFFQSLANHLFSATELDWLFRGVAPNYSIDQHASQFQIGGTVDTFKGGTLIRSGGSFAPYYYAVFIPYLFIVGRNCSSYLSRSASRRGNPIIVGSSLFVVASAFLPQSHELRYYLSALMVPALIAVAEIFTMANMRQYVYFSLLVYLSISGIINFIQPLKTTVSSLLLDASADYAVFYPVRDLPTKELCLSNIGGHQIDADDTIRLRTGTAFACRIQLREYPHIKIINDNSLR